VRVAIEKVEGVEAVEVSLRKAGADVRLRPGNTLSLEQLRQLVKTTGFVSRDATVTAIGTAREDKSRLTVAVSGTTSVLSVSRERSDAAAYTLLAQVASSAKPVMFEIAGVVVRQRDGSDEVAITSLTPSR
jgi:hypothetical protein